VNTMSVFEKVLCLLSIVCFGMCLAVLIIAIDLKWGSMWYLWCGLMIAWHGSVGFVGVYEFLSPEMSKR
jgi:hypothetical protein